jgi:hypothetical protein
MTTHNFGQYTLLKNFFDAKKFLFSRAMDYEQHFQQRNFSQKNCCTTSETPTNQKKSNKEKQQQLPK